MAKECTMPLNYIECVYLDCQIVKVIIMVCTAKTSLFETYSGKMVQDRGFQVIFSQENTLFLGKVEIDQTPSITKQTYCRN